MSEIRLRVIDGEDRWSLVARATLGLAILGVALRLVRYLQNFPFWCDETMLAVNLLDRRWTDLARPLDYRQVCPPGFLAMAWIGVKGLGFSEMALRLVPVSAALASVPLFTLLARRFLGVGTIATLLAVGLFAVAQPPIRFAGEFKPYAVDLLVASALLLPALNWRAAPGRSRALWVMAAIAPLAVTGSLPSLFVIAAITLVVLCRVAVERRAHQIAALAVFLAATGAAVAAMAALGQYQTNPADRAYFLDFWATAFPPSWRNPSALVGWLIRVHTGPLFAYPHGATRLPAWLNLAVVACFLVGIAVRARRDRTGVALLVLPFLLTFVASVFRRYPYGMSPRVAQFLVPSTLLLVAAGLDELIARIPAVSVRRGAVRGLVGLLILLGGWRLAVDLNRPYRTPWDRTAREFARWFWEELGTDAELVCVRSDLGIPFRPERWTYDGTDQYLCYQRIYSTRHRLGLAPRWDAVSATHPLRCVLLNRMPFEVVAFQTWLEENRDRYLVRNIALYPATRGSAAEPALIYVVCELVPVPGSQNLTALRIQERPER